MQLHRDPLEVIGSFCSLVAVSAGTSARRIDFAAIGALWPGVWADGLARAHDARARTQPGRWIDIRYERLVSDPVGTVGTLYEAFGFPFTDQFAHAIRDHVTRHPQHHGGLHEYKLSDSGIDPDRERERFANIGGEARIRRSVTP